jgi:hypothetical protein
MKAGLLERLLPGWYRIVGATVPLLQDLHLAQRYLSRRQRNCASKDRQHPASLFTGRSGALILGSEVFAAPLRPEMLVDHSRRIRLSDAPFDLRRANLVALGWSRQMNLAVAEPCKVLLDLADDPELPLDVLRQAAYQVMRCQRVSPHAVATAVKVARGRGAVRLGGLLESGALDVESEMEWKTLLQVFGANPPAPDCQVTVRGGVRCDFVFVFSAVIIEYYGEAYHRDRIDADGQRIYLLQQLGYHVIVITKSMMKDPSGLAAHIHHVRAIANRRCSPGT